MLTRNERGKLALNTLELEIFISDLFAKCENESEVTWVQEHIQQTAEIMADERLNEISPDSED